ncbi:hypothetical protein [Miltoncostaea oceani]|uniref:hypothetical protein n=1 Tax=Miltoncostaea oceani TaxID=2843216 RepID=UPI001C3CDC39|nr:hypothetical protein [Miltoncostaea oceani]
MESFALPRDPLTGRPSLRQAEGSGSGRLIGNPRARELCPFCDSQIEQQVDRIAAAAGLDHWMAASVRNKWPVLTEDQGRHEVLLPCLRHAERLWDLTDGEVARFLAFWHRRLEACAAGERDLFPLMIMNQGEMAGCSQPHLHSQLIGLPAEPDSWGPRRKRVRARDCVICRGDGTTSPIITRQGEFTVWAPYHCRTGLIRIAPESHTSALSAEQLRELGPLVRRVARASTTVMGTLDCSLMLFAWFRLDRAAAHWHLELVPRKTAIATVELSTGFSISSIDASAYAAAVSRALTRG